MTELDSRLQAISDELERVEESAMYAAQSQFEDTKKWRGVNLWLGIPASGFAAVAGAAVLTSQEYRLWAGLAALVGAAFGAVLTTVNATQRMNQAAAAANAYLEIQNAARQARLVDLPGQDFETARAVLAELTSRRDEQNRSADVPGRRAYMRGKRNLFEGAQTFDVDARDGHRG